LAVFVVGTVRGADEIAPNPTPVLKQYCFQCHSGATPMGGVSLVQLASQTSVGESFAAWGKVASVLEQRKAAAEQERKVAPVGPLYELSSTGSFHQVVGLFYAPELSDVHAT
jgi:hypothetical protein